MRYSQALYYYGQYMCLVGTLCFFRFFYKIKHLILKIVHTNLQTFFYVPKNAKI